MRNLLLLQLVGVDGEPVGLYLSPRNKTTSEIQEIFDAVFEEGQLIEESTDDEDWHIMTYVDDALSTKWGVVRVFADEITTSVV